MAAALAIATKHTLQSPKKCMRSRRSGNVSITLFVYRKIYIEIIFDDIEIWYQSIESTRL